MRLETTKDERPEVLALFQNLKANAESFERLLKRCNEERADAVYRFYHQSFKAYALQTHRIIFCLIAHFLSDLRLDASLTRFAPLPCAAVPSTRRSPSPPCSDS